MGKFAQFVVGPAGSGKSTFCRFMQDYLGLCRRSVHIINLDPAADALLYRPSADIREAYHLDISMEKLKLGPNGALVATLETALAPGSEWCERTFFGPYEEDYIIVDLPGQVELFAHSSVLPAFLDRMRANGWYVCVVYLLDATFTADIARFVGGAAMATSVLSHLDAPGIGLLSKADLLVNPRTGKRRSEASIRMYLDVDLTDPALADELEELPPHQKDITIALADVVRDMTTVGFRAFDVRSPSSLRMAAAAIDEVLQYFDDAEPHEPADEDDGEHDDGGLSFPTI